MKRECETEQANYWHAHLEGSRKEVTEALKIFPSPVVTFNNGWLTKDISLYHSGGAIKADGSRTNGQPCLECQLPTYSFVVKTYLPIITAGFKFENIFASERLALDFKESTSSSFELSELDLYEPDMSSHAQECIVSGFIASESFQAILDFYGNAKKSGISRLGKLRFAPRLKFSLEDSRLI